jgi:acyl carrier protein
VTDVAKILELVQTTVEETAGERPDIQPSSPLISSGILDSLSMMRLYVELQDTFEVPIDISDLTEEAFETVEAIAALVELRRKEWSE